MKKNSNWKYTYLIITLPIYILYIIFIVLVLGMGDDIWDGLVKKVRGII